MKKNMKTVMATVLELGLVVVVAAAAAAAIVIQYAQSI